MARKSVKAEVGPIDASARLRMPYARLLVPEEEGGYRAEILEFPGCIALGDDAAEALSELEVVAEDWIDAALEMGTPIPPPLEETDYSGRLNLRLPKSLHRKAALAAEFDGVSLNQFIVSALATYLGEKSVEQRAPTQIFVGTRGPQQWVEHSTTPLSRMLADAPNFETKTTASLGIFHYADR
jgi:predicted RNase H-like HicB family nuclease